ncbi:NupC/NupG family nucleoside CNT transporter [Bacillaceae bacterium SIJ1]|uniref:NupC/NupG family nucleoside CNT transporter n=1 Tax=Litoribacterium kuwaitense TaxID=1398745 RepID=UPI0013EAE9E0|nr:nucleoside transporter C-terminal domain-containing protein [Litoribacterium kuwaitense]NGP44817.1 NupC/NupG family nucleoside CNT transporter [Litoribacterium kuwaitense]
MNILFFFIGLATVFSLAWLWSSNRKAVRYKSALILLGLQLVITFILLQTTIGVTIISYIAAAFDQLIKLANTGTAFIFGSIFENNQGAFVFNVLMPIIFVSILVGILNYIRVLPLVIKYVGLALSKINGLGKLENYFAVASAFFGQSEVFLTTKTLIPNLPKERLYTLCASAISSVSLPIIAAFMNVLPEQYVVIAVVLNIFSALIISSIINPYKVEPEEDLLEVREEKRPSLFQVIADSIIDGGKIAVIVGIMVLGFVALINFVDALFLGTIQMSFQTLLGYVFSPIAFLLGFPTQDLIEAGNVMATKIISNEFVAQGALSSLQEAGAITERTIGILTVYLVSFANFGSIGIVTGAVKAMNGEKGDIVAGFGLKLLYGSVLASFLSATVIGLFLSY